MRISFDIDDTLICDLSVPTEQYVPRWRRWRYPERLRHGTRSLLAALVRRQCQIWLYTSSCRSPRYLKAWFASFGIRIEGVVNLERHQQTIGLRGPSKFPPAFGIDLHIDDSPGVAMEGESHQFAVLVVKPDDPDWAEKVLAEVDQRSRLNPHRPIRRSASGRRFDLRALRQVSSRLKLADYPLPDYAVGVVKSDLVGCRRGGATGNHH